MAKVLAAVLITSAILVDAVMIASRSMPMKLNRAAAIVSSISTIHRVHCQLLPQEKSCASFLKTNTHQDLWHRRQKNRLTNIRTHWTYANNCSTLALAQATLGREQC